VTLTLCRAGRHVSAGPRSVAGLLVALVCWLMTCWVTVGLAAGPAVAAPGAPADASVTAAARALAIDPVYVSRSSGTPSVDVAAVRAALAPQTVVAVLPEAAVRGTPGGVDGVAPELSARLGRGGTVLVLAGRQLGAASTLVAGSLSDDLTTARAVITGRPNDPAAPGLALLTLERSVGAGTGGTAGIAPDPSTAPQAGSSGGASGLYALLAVLVVAAVLGLQRLLAARRRRSSPPRATAPPPRRTRVEVDAYGQITRRVRPDEQP